MDDSEPRFSYWPAIAPPGGVELVEGAPAPCAYLPGQTAQVRAFWTKELGDQEYRQLMDAGFRRSGRVVYQPICASCRACVPLRVPTATFTPNKSQRCCRRKNADIKITVGLPEPTREKFELYGRYQREWHGRAGGKGQTADVAAFVEFLYDSPVDTREFEYRDGAGKLLAVGICDVGQDWISSVYFYFDPAEARRGLGTFGALHEIAWACAQVMKYWYAGYWVEACAKMNYKADFRPHEVLGTDGVWRTP